MEFLALATTSLNPRSDPRDPDLGVTRCPPFPLGDILIVLLEFTIGTPAAPEELISCACVVLRDCCDRQDLSASCVNEACPA